MYRQVDCGGCEWQDAVPQAQAWTDAEEAESGRHSDCDRDLASEQVAHGDHVHYGLLPGKRDLHLYHQGTLQFRQLHQQQGLMLCFRTRCRDRKKPDIHEDEGSPCAEEVRRRQAWKKKRKRHQDGTYKGKRIPDREDARRRHECLKNVSQDRHSPQHLVQISAVQKDHPTPTTPNNQTKPSHRHHQHHIT